MARTAEPRNGKLFNRKAKQIRKRKPRYGLQAERTQRGQTGTQQAALPARTGVWYLERAGRPASGKQRTGQEPGQLQLFGALWEPVTAAPAASSLQHTSLLKGCENGQKLVQREARALADIILWHEATVLVQRNIHEDTQRRATSGITLRGSQFPHLRG
jgi:hypothetical protein